MNETEKANLKHFHGIILIFNTVLIAKKCNNLDIYRHMKEKVLVSERLYHLGRTFFQEKQAQDPKKKEVVYNFQEVKQDLQLRDLILCYNMVNFHVPNLYQEGLSGEIIMKE